MTPTARRLALLAASFLVLPPTASLRAQQPTRALPAACDTVTRPEPGSGSSPDARRLLDAATQAELLGDRAAASDLLRRAARLAPGDPEVEYRLGRVLEADGESGGAVAAYCRYLATAPPAADAAEVERRLAALAPPERVAAPVAEPEPPPATRSTPSTQSAPATGPAPPRRTPPAATGGQAIAPRPAPVLPAALLLPGYGQFRTGRPVAGVMVGLTAVGALVVGSLDRKIRIECLSTPVNGACPTGDTLRRSVERPLLLPGVAVAVASTAIAALEAHHFRGRRIDASDESTANSNPAARLLPPGVSTGDGGRVELSMVRIRF